MRFEGEEVKAVALGTAWVAAATSLNFLRIYTDGGLQVCSVNIVIFCSWMIWFLFNGFGFCSVLLQFCSVYVTMLELYYSSFKKVLRCHQERGMKILKTRTLHANLIILSCDIYFKTY